MTGKLDATEAFFQRVCEARALADGGDYSGAEARFRALLDEARGQHDGNHAKALTSLITLYGRSGRYLEAYLLARRLAEMARAAGPEGDPILASALGSICGALSHLRLTDALGDAVSAMRAVLDRLPEPLAGLELQYRSAAGTHAANLQNAFLARRHITAYRKTIDGAPGLEPIYRWALAMAEARVSLLEGHPEVAKELMPEVRDDAVTPAHHRLHEVVVGVTIDVARGERAEACRLAGEAIAILESVHQEPQLASDCIHQGNLLAREMEKLGEVELASQVHDLVASVVMIRFRQMDECMQRLPELGLGDPESTAIMTAFRKEFLEEQKALLHRIAALLESQGAAHVRSLLTASSNSDLIAVCAWCESVSADGRWLPIGHFVPRQGKLRVTHGICPTCVETVTAESA